MNVLVPDYEPSVKQTIFHTSRAFETFYGGAAGGGKTAALAAQAITDALRMPKTFVYVFRKTLPEIMLSIHMEIARQLSAYNANCKADAKIEFNGQSHKWNFPNESFIQYAFCQYDIDMYRYQSAEIHTLLVDELTHFTQEWYDYFKTRVRSNRGHRLRVMAASNPGNIGHGWVKKYFVDNGDQVIYKDPTNARTRQFIKAIIDDHPDSQFRENYIITLEAISSEKLRKALRWGDWSTFEGQVFMEWDERLHVIPAMPEGVLQTCDKYIGYDLGRRDPGCAMWIAYAPENEFGVRHYYLYREIYKQMMNAREWAEEIVDHLDFEPVEYMILPHDAFSIGSGAEKSTAQVFEDHDIPIARVNSLNKGARMHRQDLLHQLLQISPDGTPYLQVLQDCRNFIRTVPDLSYDDSTTTKREDIASASEDHAYDAATYGLIVIDDQESWLSEPKAPESNFNKTPYEGQEDQTIVGQGVDVERILSQGNTMGRDWRDV